MDLSALLNPSATAAPPVAAPPAGTTLDTQPTDLKSQWDSALANPALRAGLLSFGLQALTGGWGSGMTQIAGAVGAGAEAASANESDAEAKALKAQARTDTLGQNAEENKIKREEIGARKDIANTVAGSRVQAASIRANLDSSGQKMWDSIYTKTLTGKQQAAAMGIGDGDPTTWATEAQTAADTALSARSAAPTAKPGPGGTTPPPTQPGATEPPTGGTKGTHLYNDLIKKGADKKALDTMLLDPKKRAEFEAKFGPVKGVPALTPNMDAAAPDGIFGTIMKHLTPNDSGD